MREEIMPRMRETQGMPCQSCRPSPGFSCPSIAPHGQLVIVPSDVGSRALVPLFTEIAAQAALHGLDNKHRGRFLMTPETTMCSKLVIPVDVMLSLQRFRQVKNNVRVRDKRRREVDVRWSSLCISMAGQVTSVAIALKLSQLF